ncbi:MAG: accessory Sec system translocase SecA2, partial [Rhodococcus sp. (in: high G+C Gram-positive bacteria)]
MALGSDRLWRVLGRSAQKGQARSRSRVDLASEHQDWARGLTDSELTAAATSLRVDRSEDLDVPRYLALVREASDRAVELRPFDVQLLAAVRMMAGDVVEMATGEGKTLAGAVAAGGYVLSG